MTEARVLIFVNELWPQAESRQFAQVLGVNGAARLAGLMLVDALAKAREADVGPIELCVTGVGRWKERLPTDVIVTEQGEGNPGARIQRAVERSLKGEEGVLVMRMDCPDLCAIQLRGAVAALDSVDSVIHPAFDGGFALLGLTRSVPELFQEMSGRRKDITEVVLNRLGALGVSTLIGRPIRNIRVADDLVWLPPSWQPYL